MTMRSKPSDVGALDETGTDANHLSVFIQAKLRPISLRRNAAALWDRFFSGLPDSVVPLTDKSGPVLHVQANWLFANLEFGFLIAIGGSCQQVHAVELAS